MNILSLFTLFGGLGIFLYGMNVMGESLEKCAGGKLKSILEGLTSNPFKGIILGAVVTAIIQSSSATTVMVVGFVNSGIMNFSQSIGIIMGANIGTTITSWLLSLTGVESSNIFVQIFKPEALSLISAIVGIILYMFVKSSKSKDYGGIFLGFAVLLMGMEMMSEAVKPLAEIEEFRNILTLFSNPILGVLTGAILTAVIQSSSASVGILQALSTTGQITFLNAVPIILGQNIGTCATALLSSIGANKNAKRTAVVHLCFNIIGTVLFMIVFYIFKWAVDASFLYNSVNAAGIAFVHSVFNIFSTVVMIPFIKLLEKLAYIIIKDENRKESVELLDERLLQTPAVAIAQCKRLTVEMAKLSKDSFVASMNLIDKYDKNEANRIIENEDKSDIFEDRLGTFLVKACRKNLSVKDSHETSNLLHTIGDFERISDHALNMMKVAKEINDKKIVFSDEAKKDLITLKAALIEILELTQDAFENNDLSVAKKVEPLEQVIDKIKSKMKKSHIERLQQGKCTIETGFVLSDLITNCERVADHCSNIAVCLIQVADDSFDTHEYLNNVKSHGDASFDSMYLEYKNKYGV